MVSGLPTGIVTLLFTDVEGSTRLLHELGDEYGEALHEHRRRLRAAFADHEGIEVDTQGDAFFFAFARASSAVAAATVLTFALGHDQLPPSYSVAARPALDALEAELSSDQLAGVRHAAAAASLEDLVTQALEPTA